MKVSMFSYFRNKVFIGVALFVIGAGLAINTIYLVSQRGQNNFQIRSRAQQAATVTPALISPAGCVYEQIESNAYSADCPPNAPTVFSSKD